MVELQCSRSGWSTVRDPETGDRVSLSTDVDEETAARLVDRYDPVSYATDPADTDDGDDGDGEDGDVEPPFTPGEKTIDELEDELANTDYDDAELEALADAERDGENRDGALDVIEEASED